MSGTPHLQGYIHFTSPASMEQIKVNCPVLFQAHLEPAYGTAEQNRTYCLKEAGIYHEWGQIPKQGSRTDIVSMKESIKAGASLEELFDTYPGLLLRYSKGTLMMMDILQDREEDREVEVTFIHGEPGTGKTRLAIQQARAQGTWFKLDNNKWFDGYHGQQTLIIDDYCHNDWNREFFLKILDRYPMRVEVKGGSVKARWTRIYITSNFGIPQDPAVRRRIKYEIQLDEPWFEPHSGTEVSGNTGPTLTLPDEWLKLNE